MKKIWTYTIFVLLLITICIVIVLGLEYPVLFNQFREIIEKNVYKSLIAVLTLSGLVVGGVIRNPPSSVMEFLENTLVQIAIIVFFLFISGLIWYAYNTNQTGIVIIQLDSVKKDLKLRAELKTKDTLYEVRIPGPIKEKRGDIKIRITEPSYFPDEQLGTIDPERPDTIKLVARLITGQLTINSNPPGATVYLNGISKGTTPDTIEISETNKYSIRLEKEGYKEKILPDTVLTNSKIVDLGIIPLQLIEQQYTLTIVPRNDFYEYTFEGNNYSGGVKKQFRLLSGNYEIRYKYHNVNNYRIIPIEIKSHDITVYIPQ